MAEEAYSFLFVCTYVMESAKEKKKKNNVKSLGGNITDG
jgi:hypothetical protein